MKISEIQQDSIEKIICEQMDLLERSPLEEGLDPFLEHIYENPNTDFSPFGEFLPEIIAQRLELFHTLKIDQRCIIAIVIICDKPAVMVMYLWFLQWVCFKRNIKKLDFDTFYLEIFSDGYFKDADLKKIWHSQKVIRANAMDSNNLVDYVQGGLSIQFK